MLWSVAGLWDTSPAVTELWFLAKSQEHLQPLWSRPGGAEWLCQSQPKIGMSQQGIWHCPRESSLEEKAQPNCSGHCRMLASGLGHLGISPQINFSQPPSNVSPASCPKWMEKIPIKLPCWQNWGRRENSWYFGGDGRADSPGHCQVWFLGCC